MKRLLARGAMLLVAALALHAHAAAVAEAPAAPRHFLWEVASLTNRIYLYGTIHAGRRRLGSMRLGKGGDGPEPRIVG